MNKKLIIVFALIAASVFGIGYAKAVSYDSPFVDLVAEKVAEKLLGMEELALGTITLDKSTFDHGIEILNGLDVTGAVDLNSAVNVDGATTLNGNVTIGDAGSDTFTVTSQMDANATTSIDRLDMTGGQIAMVWTSSTYGFATADDPTVFIKTRNTGADMICDSPVLDVTTAAVSVGYTSITVGTTTIAGDSSLTATTTGTLLGSFAFVSTTADYLSVWRNNTVAAQGTYYDPITVNASGTPWIWGNNVYLVMASSDAGGSTSSDDITLEGGFTGVGKLHLNCWNRY